MGFFGGIVSDDVTLSVKAVLTDIDAEWLFCFGVFVGVSDRPSLDRRRRVFRVGRRE